MQYIKSKELYIDQYYSIYFSTDIVYNKIVDIKDYLLVYCYHKSIKLSLRFERLTNFEEIIDEISEENFIVIENRSRNHPKQMCFLVLIKDYPVVVPFNKTKKTIRLITYFPDRRFKHGQIKDQ